MNIHPVKLMHRQMEALEDPYPTSTLASTTIYR